MENTPAEVIKQFRADHAGILTEACSVEMTLEAKVAGREYRIEVVRDLISDEPVFEARVYRAGNAGWVSHLRGDGRRSDAGEALMAALASLVEDFTFSPPDGKFFVDGHPRSGD